MNSSSKVCHISTLHPPFDPRIFYRQCRSLARAGYDTHLIVPLESDYKRVDGVYLHSVGNIADERAGFKGSLRFKRFRQAFRLCQIIHADIYHLHDPELIPLGLWLRFTTRSRIVFDCHEHNIAFLREKTEIWAPVRRLSIWIMQLLEKLAAQYFDAIVTADEGVERIYRNRYRARRVITINNFPLLELFSLQEASTIDVERPYDLVYHGSLAQYRINNALEIAQRLKTQGHNVKWFLFGPCPNTAWLLKEIESRGLSDVFTIYPEHIPHNKVMELVLSARIGIIPLPDIIKFRYNVPTKLFEYMALGMPVILSNLPPSRPYLKNTMCAIMISPNDYDGYVDAIAKLLKNPELRQKMGLIGKKRIKETYNWESEASKLLTLYSELLKSS